MTRSITLIRTVAAALIGVMFTSCAAPYATTGSSTYRSSSPSSDSVLPAVIGVAAVGGLLYAASKHKSHKKKHYNRGYHSGYHKGKHDGRYTNRHHGYHNNRYNGYNRGYKPHYRSHDYHRSPNRHSSVNHGNRHRSNRTVAPTAHRPNRDINRRGNRHSAVAKNR